MTIISRIKNAIKKNNLSFYELRHHKKKSDDIYSMAVLQSLLIGYPYIPFNGGALRPFCITYILNEIVINQRQRVLEFGSGISTILMARLIKKNKLDAKIISIEHNEAWAETLKEYLDNEDLLKFVTIIRVDLKDVTTSKGTVNWYDFNVLTFALKEKKFDLVIIDGPPANTSKLQYSRFPALEKLEDILTSDFCIVLDDVNRKGEQALVEFYKQKNRNVTYKIVSETLGVFRNRDKFSPIPIRY
ncbi:class I SAM-dependent methyltransferase [Mangrovimonas sp. CR14]|uniref:O-methyltransferase n=1 Tax=Mangrovimonas sp. CR14 TaxID=2706120 RepID=UPI0014223ED6|nr:class I SAM-dependent methyltransferase [Mangrovimonas sp. CR14]NIK92528.1 class I SAM-dependent methyltransferase [Mangrovimonas sp. CR14]